MNFLSSVMLILLSSCFLLLEDSVSSQEERGSSLFLTLVCVRPQDLYVTWSLLLDLYLCRVEEVLSRFVNLPEHERGPYVDIVALISIGFVASFVYLLFFIWWIHLFFSLTWPPPHLHVSFFAVAYHAIKRLQNREVNIVL